jgi:SAM-dependent methyltransferase
MTEGVFPRAVGASEDYTARVAQELAIYADEDGVPGLPPIYEYWSSRYVQPRLKAVGLCSLEALWAEPVIAVCSAQDDIVHVASVGSGNGELEVALARTAAEAGCRNLRLSCVELNPAMLDRTAARARHAGVDDLIELVEADFNTWTPDGQLDVAIASHSLHHVVSLEHLLDGLLRALRSRDGVFVINDMIGRNGHQRWPEAFEFLQAIWACTPQRYRWNHQLGRHEERYEDWDCSAYGFEGIRSQDILPLLLERFHPEKFVVFGNLIDPFIDRGFGPNLDPERGEDRFFIDAVAQLDDAAIDLGVLTPTHLVGSFRTRNVDTMFVGPRSPQASLRQPDRQPSHTSGSAADGSRLKQCPVVAPSLDAAAVTAQPPSANKSRIRAIVRRWLR